MMTRIWKAKPLAANAVHLRPAFVALLTISLIAACAYRDEGATDYRKSEISVGFGAALIGPEFSNRLNFGQTAAPAGKNNKVPGLNLQREDVRLVALVRKNSPSLATKVTFTEQDSVSIRLIGAYINFYSEGPFSTLADLVIEGQIPPRGEVAIVVNAFQLGEASADFDFSSNGIEKGRVVYYSQDVQQGQFLNFNNMPVYGPAMYNAKSIGIDLAVLELDLSDKIAVGLLNELASLGAKAFPAAAPELMILTKLGQSVIKEQTNDINARYFVLFDAPEGSFPDLPRTTLEVGNYVFIRAQDRLEDINWNELLLDENTGRLYRREFEFAALTPPVVDDMKGLDEEGKEYVVVSYLKNNYLTFQINKNESARVIDLANYDFKTFLDKLNKDLADKDKKLTEILEPIDGLVEKRTQIALFDQIRTDLATLATEKMKFDQLRAASVDSAGKLVSNPELMAAKGRVFRKFNAIWSNFSPSLSPPPEQPAAATAGALAPGVEKTTHLSASQRDYVLAKFEEVAELKLATDLKFFHTTGESIGGEARKVGICRLILAEEADSRDSVCLGS